MGRLPHLLFDYIIGDSDSSWSLLGFQCVFTLLHVAAYAIWLMLSTMPMLLYNTSVLSDLKLSIPAEERQSPELYARNVRKLMGEALGAELSTHGIPQQQALKRNGIYVDWTGRCVMHCLRHFSTLLSSQPMT